MLQGLQTKRARFEQSFGRWFPRSPIFDRLYSIDLSQIPIGEANIVPVVAGVEDFCVVINGMVLIPVADPTTLIQTAFPILEGMIYDQNGSPAVLTLPFPGAAPSLRTIAALQTYTDGKTVLPGPVVLAPGFPLNVYAVGAQQSGTNYQLCVSFAVVKLVPQDEPAR